MAIISHSELVDHLIYVLQASSSEYLRDIERSCEQEFPTPDLASLGSCITFVSQAKAWEVRVSIKRTPRERLDFVRTLDRVIHCYELQDEDFKLAWAEAIMRDVHTR